MPVVELNINRIRKLVSGTATRKQILDVLPFLGLDIESQDGDQIRMGNTLEFRSGGDFMYRFRNNVRVGVGVFHISNAGLGYRNPGS